MVTIDSRKWVDWRFVAMLNPFDFKQAVDHMHVV
jgi:hypothetical protein